MQQQLSRGGDSGDQAFGAAGGGEIEQRWPLDREFATEHERRCLPLVVHGDAAFAAQGVVYETLGLSQVIALDILRFLQIADVCF